MLKAETGVKPKIAPVPTIRRIPSYLRLLYEYKNEGKEWISATEIAERLSLKPIQVRKDMTFTGIVGKPKRGFLVRELIERTRRFLGWANTTDAIIVGAGALGSALMGYPGFSELGLNIVAAFDNHASKIGSTIHGRKIYPISQIKAMVLEHRIRIAIITVPAPAAQGVADELTAAGIEGIWNFSPTELFLPDSVVVQREDLTSGLAVLSVKLNAAVEE